MPDSSYFFLAKVLVISVDSAHVFGAAIVVRFNPDVALFYFIHNVINCTQLCISLSLYLSRCTIVCTSYHIVPRNLSLQRPSLCAGALMRELPRTRSTRTLKTSAAECKVLYITIYNLILYISSVLKYVETVSMSVNAAFAFMILFMVSFCHL